MTSNPLKLGLTVCWIATSALQYGFHIAALNSSASSIICDASRAPTERHAALGRPSCVDMSDAAFGTVTSAYTVGGLVGSLGAGGMLERWGKKGTAVRSAALVVLGASAVSFGSSLLVLVLGRILIGVSCGIATVLVPLYLSSVAPPSIAGGIGILTQISINVGIFAAQGFSIPLSTPGTGNWRFVSLISIAVAAAQILTSPLVPESRAKDASSARGYEEIADEGRTPLAADDEAPAPRRKDDDPDQSLSVSEILRSPDPAVRKALWTLVAVMLFQQFSGINAVMYYSTKILTAVNPGSAKMVSLYVTLVNLVMTFPAVSLIDRLGRRTLLLFSLASMSASTAVLGWAINTDHFTLASAGIIAFVVSFALGLGPVPFVLVGELPPKQASSATASIAVAVNWLSNLVVGVGFLPLRDWLAGPSGDRSGSVFWVFTALTALGVVVVGRLVR
ncbi:general substrate transporter [Rhodotorula diobovata]|uniref:General substrate transporter n=1 Tax=Rhodotorula diobovata TaxID=5288 RepID=A0A5C5G7U2_9BASI|nr:general substrate transporter [Rhodotorula diobovata]